MKINCTKWGVANVYTKTNRSKNVSYNSQQSIVLLVDEKVIYHAGKILQRVDLKQSLTDSG